MAQNSYTSLTLLLINEIKVMKALESEIDYEPFLLPGRCWKVLFIGESVDDCGGGYSGMGPDFRTTSSKNQILCLGSVPVSISKKFRFSKRKEGMIMSHNL